MKTLVLIMFVIALGVPLQADCIKIQVEARRSDQRYLDVQIDLTNISKRNIIFKQKQLPWEVFGKFTVAVIINNSNEVQWLDADYPFGDLPDDGTILKKGKSIEGEISFYLGGDIATMDLSNVILLWLYQPELSQNCKKTSHRGIIEIVE